MTPDPVVTLTEALRDAGHGVDAAEIRRILDVEHLTVHAVSPLPGYPNATWQPL